MEIHIYIALDEEKQETPVCQSCGMPMNGQEWGTEVDGCKSTEYCKDCYENGAFTTAPTLEGMIEQCLPFLMQSSSFENEEAARQAMRRYLPTLRRWKKTQ